MVERFPKLSLREKRWPEGVVGLQHQRGITGAPGQPQQVLAQRAGSSELPAPPVVQPETPERGEEMGSVRDFPRQGVRAGVGALDFRSGPAVDGPDLAT